MGFKDKILDALGFSRDVEADFKRGFEANEAYRVKVEAAHAAESLRQAFGVEKVERAAYKGLGQPANDRGEPQAEVASGRDIA